MLHYHRSPINMICVHHLLTLVHYVCIWIGEPIPIIDMLIHKITELPYKGVNPAREFGGKPGEKDLEDKMKKEFGLIKKVARVLYHVHIRPDNIVGCPDSSRQSNEKKSHG